MNIVNKIEEILDEKGNCVEARNYDESGKLSNRMVYEYDEAGKVLSFKMYEDNEHISQNWKYVYNDKNQRVKEEYFDENEKMTGYKEISYNAAGENAGYVEYDTEGNVLGKEQYLFDEKNRKIESFYSMYFNGMKFEKKFEMEYDSDDNLIKEKSYTNGVLSCVFEYEYTYWD